MRLPNVSLPISAWRDPRHRRGIAGELAAARYLQSRGFTIEAHRFRLRHHDVDLVARRGHLVVFVEVKARTTDRFGLGAEGIGRQKQRNLGRVASTWIARFGRRTDSYRYDVVVVRWRGGGVFPEICHIEGAFFHIEK